MMAGQTEIRRVAVPVDLVDQDTLLRAPGLASVNFATSRAHAMNSCATGPRVRFFKVMIPTGRRVVGKWIGRRLSAGLYVRNVSTELGTIVRKRPVASRALRTTVGEVTTVARGMSSPLARKASAATEPDRLSGGGSIHGSFMRSASFALRRRVHGFCEPAATTSNSS